MEALENIESGVSRLSAARHYIEQLSKRRSAPTAKLRLAALRHLFDWLVIGQVMPTNPAAAVRGPRHIVRRGKTPVLDPAEARQLIDAIGAGCDLMTRSAPNLVRVRSRSVCLSGGALIHCK